VGPFFCLTASKGEVGVLVRAFLTLWFGSIIVAFHNVCSWDVPVILTVFGWGQVLKGAIYFIFPSYGLKMISCVTEENAPHFRYAAPLLLIVALLLAWNLWWR
jgi:hypothetical protein